MEMTYNEALSELESIVEEIEDDSIKLDQLTAKVREAYDLVEFCELKLRSIDDDLKNINRKS